MKPSEINSSQGYVPAVREDAAVASFIGELNQQAIPGTMVKFDGKKGVFVRTDTDEALDQETEYVAYCGQVLDGWIKFGAKGEPPTRIIGMPFDGFVRPPREDLGDTDESLWEPGLSGKPQDPWQHQVMLPLERADNAELFVFVTSSVTGRMAVGKLLDHYQRMARAFPDEQLTIKLKVGGFKHRDDRIGWVPTPTLAAVGRRGGAPKAEFDDKVPF